MGFFDRLFSSKPKNVVLQDPRKPAKASQPTTQAVAVREAQPAFKDEPIPDSLSLGWYFSETAQQMQMVKIPLKDRATHMYVIGASGSGKTKFIEFPIQQDIKLGNGFGIIDPHGDSVQDDRG
jgi:type IV secretory pathway VirB4 component